MRTIEKISLFGTRKVCQVFERGCFGWGALKGRNRHKPLAKEFWQTPPTCFLRSVFISFLSFAKILHDPVYILNIKPEPRALRLRLLALRNIRVTAFFRVSLNDNRFWSILIAFPHPCGETCCAAFQDFQEALSKIWEIGPFCGFASFDRQSPPNENLPDFYFLACCLELSISKAASAFQLIPRISPIPRMREAVAVDRKFPKRQYPPPTPRILIGTPGHFTNGDSRAATASPSILVKISST
jgi:hypothetical protein